MRRRPKCPSLRAASLSCPRVQLPSNPAQVAPLGGAAPLRRIRQRAAGVSRDSHNAGASTQSPRRQ
eukprot:1760255-Lingulodinium_polyedra.AAC.1